ncbi:MAG TPA: ABC transporter substrate-binding protein [Steroidobacteraceae bacterium]|jgi:branched-chain amino acid transport system substrate-binding protein|nr:ABC transporter substrate-binding protein [Steroidobacteraceae bacterium]
MFTKQSVNRRRRILALTSLVGLALSFTALAQQSYDPGASDTELKIGNIMSYSGWAQAYGAIGRAEAAYFRMVNDRGGVNGRKITFISVDNGSEAANSLELARRLVEHDGVLLIFGSLGTETNLAIRPYLNDQHVPQLFVDSSSAVFNDPAHFPWTMGFFASFRTEGLAYARYILQTRPGARIAILYADDDAGKEYLAGVQDGLGQRASSMVVAQMSYRPADGTIDPQLTALRASGADVFLNFAVGPFATQAIRKAYDLDWHPLQFIANASLSTAAFLDPAGLAKAAGIITNARSKGWLEPQTRSDPAVRKFVQWMQQYNPQASLRDQNNVAGYERAEALVEVLKRCGDHPTRANVMQQAAHLDIELGMLREGIRLRTSPDDFQPVHQLFLMKFDGQGWVPFGAVIDPAAGN